MKLYEFDDGVKLAHLYNPHTRATSVGVFFRIGSRYETSANSGISHFIEHLAFKGTPTRNAKDISIQFEELGARSNAFTTKECTAYYVTCLDDVTDKACEILADIVINSDLPIAEIERERGVILEEIDMTEDSPDDLSHELMMESYFGDVQLGKPILGQKEVIKNIDRNELLKYRKQYYTTGNCIIAVAGNITRSNAISLVEKYFVGKLPKGETTKVQLGSIDFTKSDFVSKTKKIEQANITIGFEGFAYDSREEPAYDIMLTAIGGGMSSLLFQKLREEQGLCYSVYSYPVKYRDCGVTGIYVGTSNEKVERALGSIREVIDEVVRTGVSREDFERSKTQEKASLVLGYETSMAQMRLLGTHAVFTGNLFDQDMEMKKLEAVTIEDVNAVIRKVFASPKFVVSYVGKLKDDNMLSYFKNN